MGSMARACSERARGLGEHRRTAPPRVALPPPQDEHITNPVDVGSAYNGRAASWRGADYRSSLHTHHQPPSAAPIAGAAARIGIVAGPRTDASAGQAGRRADAGTARPRRAR